MVNQEFIVIYKEYFSVNLPLPKISDFCAQRINIDDVMPVEFYFFVPLTLSTKDHESL